jgi:hypothetical protein
MTQRSDREEPVFDVQSDGHIDGSREVTVHRRFCPHFVSSTQRTTGVVQLVLESILARKRCRHIRIRLTLFSPLQLLKVSCGTHGNGTETALSNGDEPNERAGGD